MSQTSGTEKQTECAKCGKLRPNCDCELLASVAVFLQESEAPSCSICGKADAVKYGVCFECLSENDLDQGEETVVEENDGVPTCLEEVLNEEEMENFGEEEENVDPDDWENEEGENQFDDDFDDDFEDNFDEDEEEEDDWSEVEDDDSDDSEDDDDDEEINYDDEEDDDDSDDDDSPDEDVDDFDDEE